MRESSEIFFCVERQRRRSWDGSSAASRKWTSFVAMTGMSSRFPISTIPFTTSTWRA